MKRGRSVSWILLFLVLSALVPLVPTRPPDKTLPDVKALPTYSPYPSSSLSALASPDPGTLNVTDQGTWRQIDLLDENGNTIRYRVLETFGTYLPQTRVDIDYGSAFSYNLTYSTTEYVCEDVTFQLRGADTCTDLAGENITVMEQSGSMYRLRWDYLAESDEINATGYIYMTFYDHLGIAVFSSDITANEVNSSIVNFDVFWEIEANAGFFDDDGTATASNYTLLNQTYFQADLTNGNMGHFAAMYNDVTSSGSWTNSLQWDNYPASAQIQRVVKADNAAPAAGETGKSCMIYKITTGYTSNQYWHQWDADGVDYTLQNAVTMTTGSWVGFDFGSAAYEMSATNRVCEWTVDGAYSLYTPIWKITGLSGNTSNYRLKNGTNVMTKGTDYYCHWNGTNGVMYIWFTEMNGNSQSFTLEETPTGNAPVLNSPADQEWVNGTTGHTIDWIVTDADSTNGTYTVYKNGSTFDSGSWTNTAHHPRLDQR